MISKKLIKLMEHYLGHDRSKEELEAFCNQYDVIFSNFKHELSKEVSTEKFEMFDKIYMIIDSYEPNEEIRKNEPYCIDEIEMIDKIKSIFNSLTMQ